MPEKSAGILVFRRKNPSVEFLLAHPGGPFWQRKDAASWSIPKGLIENGEECCDAALREFEEEIGQTVTGSFVELTPQKQKSGKLIFCWMVEADLDLSEFKSNEFELEWPRGSGSINKYAEIDRVDYFAAPAAFDKILPGQRPFLEEALERLDLPLPAPLEETKGESRQGVLF